MISEAAQIYSLGPSLTSTSRNEQREHLRKMQISFLKCICKLSENKLDIMCAAVRSKSCSINDSRGRFPSEALRLLSVMKTGSHPMPSCCRLLSCSTLPSRKKLNKSALSPSNFLNNLACRGRIFLCPSVVLLVVNRVDLSFKWITKWQTLKDGSCFNAWRCSNLLIC